jgi:hypothetical protein
MSYIDELKKLGELKQASLLTQDEFDQQKALLLSKSTDAPAPAAAAGPVVAAPQSAFDPSTTGAILIGIPVIGIALQWLWVGNMRIIQDPVSALQMITIVVVLGTAILAAYEAKKLNMGAADDLTRKGKKREGPVTWLIANILLWIVVYPMYLKRRVDYGAKNRVAIGLIVAIVFVAGIVILNSLIDDQIRKLRYMLGR